MKTEYSFFRYIPVWSSLRLHAMKQCMSKEQFIERMKASGWKVHWKDARKHIAFENQDGKKVRNSNLEKTFHLAVNKEGLEREFIRQRETTEYTEREVGLLICRT